MRLEGGASVGCPEGGGEEEAGSKDEDGTSTDDEGRRHECEVGDPCEQRGPCEEPRDSVRIDPLCSSRKSQQSVQAEAVWLSVSKPGCIERMERWGRAVNGERLTRDVETEL